MADEKRMNKEIRFIDSGYNELFRIPDGGKIKITLNNGDELIWQCKYIDAYHFKTDKNDMFHICQFAELMERVSRTYEPTAETLKAMDLAFVEQHYEKIDCDKFFKTTNGFTEMYYNPDATAGGQIVELTIDNEDIVDAAKLHKNPKEFFAYLESVSKGALYDVGTATFRETAQSFIDSKADFEGINRKSMHGLMKAAGIMPEKTHKREDMER